ncbi:hypothetical protein SG18_21795 [Pandoraea apista]|nr:hypothetical protein SG18_21795 [Pandoraea apista]AKH74315.1 hypothetical protein XM39_21980 [Pandoraea apista]AKI62863.1 hypothetical protein AA956_15300 [Pandoraea apista]
MVTARWRIQTVLAIVFDDVLTITILLRHAVALAPVGVLPGVLRRAARRRTAMLALWPSVLRAMARWATVRTARPLSRRSAAIIRATLWRWSALGEGESGGNRQTGGEAKRQCLAHLHCLHSLS